MGDFVDGTAKQQVERLVFLPRSGSIADVVFQVTGPGVLQGRAWRLQGRAWRLQGARAYCQTPGIRRSTCVPPPNSTASQLQWQYMDYQNYACVSKTESLRARVRVCVRAC